jgi:CheY-specific phosphatase CheX
MVSASLKVLETMFFAEGAVLEECPPLADPLTCLLHCSGAVTGTFSVAMDRSALRVLCEAFYGDDEPNAVQSFELLCEFTNMIAGSTLSLFSPDEFCALTSPQLADPVSHVNRIAHPDTVSVCLGVDGGCITLAGALRAK